MKVRYTPRARGDLAVIYAYLDEQAPTAADAVKARIERRIARLADFPFLAPMTEMAGIYELTLLRYPYKIYYRVEQEEIWVLHVCHTARQSWQNER
jgi:plasmid stabilization system protein ParE